MKSILRNTSCGSIATALLLVVTLTVAALLIGCVDPFAGTAPNDADSAVVLSLKKERAALIAGIQQIRTESEELAKRLKAENAEELRRTRAENEARLESLKNELATKTEELREQIFPARTFHYAALGVVLVSGFLAWRKGEPITFFGGLLTGGCLIGIASVQRDYPWALQLLPASAMPLAVAYMIYKARREKAVRILAQAIESDDDTKAVIKADPQTAQFIEGEVRRFLPDKNQG